MAWYVFRLRFFFFLLLLKIESRKDQRKKRFLSATGREQAFTYSVVGLSVNDGAEGRNQLTVNAPVLGRQIKVTVKHQRRVTSCLSDRVSCSSLLSYICLFSTFCPRGDSFPVLIFLWPSMLAAMVLFNVDPPVSVCWCVCSYVVRLKPQKFLFWIMKSTLQYTVKNSV